MIRYQPSKIQLFSILIVFLILLIGVLIYMTNMFGKSELSSPWKERFLDSQKMNAYTLKGLKTDIGDAIIKDYKLKDLIFKNSSFSDVEWTNTTSQQLTFTDTVFRNNIFTNIEFTDAVFTNVTFQDSEFNGAVFYTNKFEGVKFIRCKFKSRSAFLGLKNSTINFEHSTFDESSFSESNATLSFRDSTLKNVRLIDLVFPSSLTFENSKLQDVDLDRAKLSKLVMENVTGGGASGFNNGSIAEVEVRNSSMGFSLTEGILGKLTFVNSVVNVSLESSQIKELQINNCKSMRDLNLYKANVEILNISNCPITDLNPVEALIQNFTIEKSSIVNSDL